MPVKKKTEKKLRLGLGLDHPPFLSSLLTLHNPMQRKRPRDEVRGRGGSNGAGGGRARGGKGLNEEISLGAGEFSSDEEGAQPPAPAPEPALETVETADEKRIRLARAYLGSIAREVGRGGSEVERRGAEEEEEEEEEDDEDAARGVLRSRPGAVRDAISHRLHQDAQLISGAFFRPLAAQLAGLEPLAFSFAKAHSVRSWELQTQNTAPPSFAPPSHIYHNAPPNFPSIFFVRACVCVCLAATRHVHCALR